MRAAKAYPPELNAMIAESAQEATGEYHDPELQLPQDLISYTKDIRYSYDMGDDFHRDRTSAANAQLDPPSRPSIAATPIRYEDHEDPMDDWPEDPVLSSDDCNPFDFSHDLDAP